MNKVEIVIPAHNEEKILEKSIELLYTHLNKIKDFMWNVTIGENGSKDKTLEIAQKLCKKYKRMSVKHFDTPSRDNVLKTIWSKSNAEILLYMDADMSTHPAHTRELIDAINAGYDIATGSRWKKGARVRRDIIRKIMSYLYNAIFLPIILPTCVRDAQCGFKAINQKVAKEVIPLLSNQNGFLDTEILVVAHHKGLRVKEIPVVWAESQRESTMSVYKNLPPFFMKIFETRKKIKNGFYDTPPQA
ncbi:glycosyltransferase [Candidatus Woesearchaeota archaeon]|nr:glycosyltransferase [Candidatus Woesearchaeota archaeon]